MLATPYHAIKRSLHLLTSGSTAVVIGVGGLGHMAVQLLDVLGPARLIAVDTSEQKLDLAREVGPTTLSCPATRLRAYAISPVQPGPSSYSTWSGLTTPLLSALR